MILRSTVQFDEWPKKLRDPKARARITIRMERLAEGNAGNSRGVGDGVVELKIDYGPGYRVYFVQRGPALIVLLLGGDKSSQVEEIKLAKVFAGKIAVGKDSADGR